MASWRLTVDGHAWLVFDRPAEPGTYHFDWLTHPDWVRLRDRHLGRHTPIDEAGMRHAISDFLAQIDPETGYLA